MTLTNLLELAGEGGTQRTKLPARSDRGLPKGAVFNQFGEIDTARDPARGRRTIDLPEDLLRQPGAGNFCTHRESAGWARPGLVTAAVYGARATYS